MQSSMPTTASRYCLAPIAAMNTMYLPKKPPVGGRPASENRKNDMARPKNGLRQPSPAQSERL